jgi:hypothetical protein
MISTNTVLGKLHIRIAITIIGSHPLFPRFCLIVPTGPSPVPALPCPQVGLHKAKPHTLALASDDIEHASP